nr:MAG TPA: hypothetical protein [Caudoviricetes sp.]
MYLGDANGNPASLYAYQWERSRYYNASSIVCNVDRDGSADYNRYNNGYGLAPAFVIG